MGFDYDVLLRAAPNNRFQRRPRSESLISFGMSHAAPLNAGVRQLDRYSWLTAMALTKNFIPAWYAWQHAGAPITNSRVQRSGAPTYEIEADLDHLASHTYQLGLWAIEGKSLNYAKLASEEITELDRINTKLKECGMNEETDRIFSEYISLTRSLLEEMERLPYNQGAV